MKALAFALPALAFLALVFCRVLTLMGLGYLVLEVQAKLIPNIEPRSSG